MSGLLFTLAREDEKYSRMFDEIEEQVDAKKMTYRDALAQQLCVIFSQYLEAKGHPKAAKCLASMREELKL